MYIKGWRRYTHRIRKRRKRWRGRGRRDHGMGRRGTLLSIGYIFKLFKKRWMDKYHLLKLLLLELRNLIKL